MNNAYFIPTIKTINGIQIPSTPFTCSNNQPLFMGDVFQITYGEDTDIYLIALKDGQYVGINNLNAAEPLWLHDQESIKVLGNSIELPELLKLLSN